jgi:ATP-dependent DNA helicase RecG
MTYQKSATLEPKAQLKADINKEIIAFANSKGGTIFVGVDGKGQIIGVQNAAEVISKIRDLAQTTIKPAVNTLTHYSTEVIDGKDIVKIEVGKGPSSPYFLAQQGLCPAGVFVRKGSASVSAPNNIIRRLIKHTDGNVYEQMRSLDQNLTFEDTAVEFARHGISFDDRRARAMGLISEDDIYTNLGLLLSDQCQHTIKVAAFAGKTKSIFKDRQQFKGPLLTQFRAVFSYLESLDQTSDKFTGVSPIAGDDYPPTALREALLNAIVHRDYSYNSSTLISIFDDRMELVSMGGLAPGINSKDIMLGISHSRNERLVKIFSDLGLIKAHGTGMQKIMDAYADCKAKPEVKISGNAFLFTLPNINAAAMAVSFTENEQAVLRLLEHQPAVTRKDVEVLLALSPAATGKTIRQLMRKDVLSVEGHGVNTKYVLKPSG